MSRPGRTGPALTAALTLAVAIGAAVGRAEARQVAVDDTTGVAVLGDPSDGALPAMAGPMLPPEIQVVRLSGPPGMAIEVIEPTPMILPVPEDEFGNGAVTVGLQVGVGYRLRLSNLPEQPGAELFPVVEVVGHLHRPPGIDPSRFPIRVIFGLDDLADVADNGRLVTQVVYLEDPDQALPISLPKDQIPVTTIGPGEEPLLVADALGRVMAIVRIGGRTPAPGEPMGLGDLGLSVGPCPFQPVGGGRCGIPVCPPLTPAHPPQAIFPGDEYLCDGGDHGLAAGIGPDGAIVGVDPRDAMVRFQTGRTPRVLPTNTVCLYAPRFAAVRVAVGPNENTLVTVPRGAETISRQMQEEAVRPPLRMTQNLSADAVRVRRRASAMEGRTPPITHVEVRVLNELSEVQAVARNELVQGPQVSSNIENAVTETDRVKPGAIKTAEGPVVTGIVQGASQAVMAWRPDELAGVETPPDQPGLAVNKEADAAIAEPGTEITFTIRWRNMGNMPIGSVSIVDSLLPRLEYVPGTARGPSGAVFTAAENAVGSTELRWDLPAVVMPGESGAVSFQARVR